MSIISQVNWPAVLTSVASFLLGIVVKTVLDLRTGLFIVKYFSWICPDRLFRDNSYKLSGIWEHVWSSGRSEAFENPLDRHSHSKLYQLGPYCTAEFIAKRHTYIFFGKLRGEYLVGEWFNKQDRAGYYGAFQLRVLDSSHLDGMWIGHSKTVNKIRVDSFKWTRIS